MPDFLPFLALWVTGTGTGKHVPRPIYNELPVTHGHFSFLVWSPSFHSSSCWSWAYSSKLHFVSLGTHPVCHLIGRSDDICVNICHQNGNPLKSLDGCNSRFVYTHQKFRFEALRISEFETFLCLPWGSFPRPVKARLCPCMQVIGFHPGQGPGLSWAVSRGVQRFTAVLKYCLN